MTKTKAKPKKSVRSATAGPEAILPLTDFRDAPWGDEPVAFKAGQLSAPVPAEFARRMRDEGKAAPRREVAAAAPAPAMQPQTAADTAE